MKNLKNSIIALERRPYGGDYSFQDPAAKAAALKKAKYIITMEVYRTSLTASILQGKVKPAGRPQVGAFTRNPFNSFDAAFAAAQNYVSKNYPSNKYNIIDQGMGDKREIIVSYAGEDKSAAEKTKTDLLMKKPEFEKPFYMRIYVKQSTYYHTDEEYLRGDSGTNIRNTSQILVGNIKTSKQFVNSKEKYMSKNFANILKEIVTNKKEMNIIPASKLETDSNQTAGYIFNDFSVYLIPGMKLKEESANKLGTLKADYLKLINNKK